MIVTLAAPAGPDDLSLLVGECLHNTRSFLDNLVFHLGVAYSGANFTPEMQERSEFPIFGTRPMTTNEETRKIGGIHPDARAIIKQLQPHHVTDIRSAPLFQLHELDRHNKHRTIRSSVMGVMQRTIGDMRFSDQVSIEYLRIGGDGLVGPSGRTELGRYRGWHVVAGIRQMRVPLGIDIDVVFADEPFKGSVVTGMLQGVLEHVENNVLQPLLPYC